MSFQSQPRDLQKERGILWVQRQGFGPEFAMAHLVAIGNWMTFQGVEMGILPLTENYLNVGCTMQHRKERASMVLADKGEGAQELEKLKTGGKAKGIQSGGLVRTSGW